MFSVLRTRQNKKLMAEAVMSVSVMVLGKYRALGIAEPCGGATGWNP